MTSEDIDAYLAAVEPARRATLEEVRRRIRMLAPDATEEISYAMPAFREGGKVVAGLAAFTKHLAYLPHSGKTLSTVAALAGAPLDGYVRTSGSLHFALDEPLPVLLLTQLIDVRRAEIARR